MKKIPLMLFLIAAIIWSCDSDVNTEVKVADQLIGNWEHDHSGIGTAYVIPTIFGDPTSVPSKYNFNPDKTFIKNLSSFNWREEGTWDYKESNKTLSLTYKTYAQEVSDTQTLDLIVETITDTELVLKKEYNKISLGEFVEFEYIFYSKK